VRGAATRGLAPLLRQLTRTGVQARLARTDLDAPVPDLGERALPPADVQRRRGEDGLTDWDVRRRRHAENARERQRVIASRHRLEAVLGALLNRQAVLRADIDARVRLAQAAGLLCHHSALARIGYYAEHLIREHADGSELVQVGWPPLPEPPSWLHDDREAAQLLTGHRVHALDAGQPEAWSENAD
jgi:hypothetical protein